MITNGLSVSKQDLYVEVECGKTYIMYTCPLCMHSNMFVLDKNKLSTWIQTLTLVFGVIKSNPFVLCYKGLIKRNNFDKQYYFSFYICLMF